MRAARPVVPLLREVRRVSTGPIRVISPTGSHEFIYEAVVDIDFRSLGGVPELSSQSAARVPACDDHHIIL